MPDTHPLRIRSICGSLRRSSFNAGLQRTLPALAPAGLSIEPLAGLGDFPLYNGDVEERRFPDIVQGYADAIRAADGLIICTPEYNNSLPGVLKNAIDWLSRLPNQPFSDKPVALQSASTGAFGGVRCQLAMRPVLATLNAFVLNRPGVLVANARTKFDEKTGELTDGETAEAIRKQLVAFEAFARRFRAS